VAAVDQVETGDVLALVVGDEHRQPVAVVVLKGLLVALAQLRAPRDQPRSFRPRREVDQVGDLRHLRVLAALPSGRIASIHADSGRPMIAWRTGSVRSNPNEKRRLASRQ
jgi:hypothetical protein